LGLPLLRSEDTFTKLLVFCLYLLVLLALIHLNEKLRFNFSFISLAFSYLGFNSLIFLVNNKLVTSFVSIVLEVTSFFNFLNFAFCPVQGVLGPRLIAQVYGAHRKRRAIDGKSGSATNDH